MNSMVEYKSNEEYLEIYVETSGLSGKFKLRKSLVEAYGGINEVKQYCEALINQFGGGINMPNLKEAFREIDFQSTMKKLELIEKDEKQRNDISSLVH